MRSLRAALVAAVMVLLTAAPAWAAPGPEPTAEPSAPLTAIGTVFRDLGGPTGSLGPVVIPERSMPGGRQQDHANGLILQRDGGQAFAVQGAFGAAYQSGSGIYLGYPLEAKTCGLPRAGCRQRFDQGSIWSSPGSAAAMVPKAIEPGWAAAGGERGWLGYPSSTISLGTLPDGGTWKEFEGGVVYRSNSTGAHGVSWPVLQRWEFSGGPSGRLGYPTSHENCGLRAGGCVQLYQGGAIYRSAGTSAQVVTGAIRTAWHQAWSQDGVLGYPTSGENCALRAGGCGQLFENGTITWTKATGARVVVGPIRSAWLNAWSQDGRLGYPTQNERCGLRGGGCFQVFQGGSVYWSPASGGHPVFGAIRDAWGRQGWENGLLGYPVSSETCGLRGGGCAQFFQNGSLYWSPATGAQVVRGMMLQVYAGERWEAGRLGYPLGAESYSGGAYRQSFQGGTITLTFGRIKVTYR